MAQGVGFILAMAISSSPTVPPAEIVQRAAEVKAVELLPLMATSFSPTALSAENSTTGSGSDGGGIATNGAITLLNSTIFNNFTINENSSGGGVSGGSDAIHHRQFNRRR